MLRLDKGRKTVIPVSIAGQESKKEGDCKTKPARRNALL